MKTTAKKSFSLKSGEIFQAGTVFNVFPSEKQPDYRAVCVPEKGKEFITSYEKLPKLFNDFHEITEEELQTACLDGFCPSLTGSDVEPDGHDSYGFPSWLIVMGFC